MEKITMNYGGFPLSKLYKTLESNNINLNRYAEIILNHPELPISNMEKTVSVFVVTPQEIGIENDATLQEIYSKAQILGFELCSLEMAIYFRLHYKTLNNSFGLKSQGKAPEDSITIATPLLEESVDFPKGLYIRRIEGTDWLRGYTCDPEHLFLKTDKFLFKK